MTLQPEYSQNRRPADLASRDSFAWSPQPHPSQTPLLWTPHAPVASTVGPATAGTRGEGDVGGERIGERILPLRGLAHTLSGSVTWLGLGLGLGLGDLPKEGLDLPLLTMTVPTMANAYCGHIFYGYTSCGNAHYGYI